MFVDLADPNIQPCNVNISDIPRVQLSQSLCDKLEDLLKREEKTSNINIYPYGGCVQIANNYILFSSQWFYFAVLCKKYALALADYCNEFDRIRNSNPNFDKSIVSNNLNKISFTSFFSDSSDADKFKLFIFGDPKFRPGISYAHLGEIQSSISVFSSCILKKIPVEESSSIYLGNLIYYLSKNPNVYDAVEKEIVTLTNNEADNIRIIDISKSVRDSAKSLVDIIYDIDKLDSLIPVIKNNKKGLKIEFKGLTDNLGKNKQLPLIFVKENSDLWSQNSNRAFHNKLYFINIDGTTTNCKLSTQWGDKDKEGNRYNNIDALTFTINVYYSNYLNIERKGNLVLVHFKSLYFSKNIIFYGAPGTGKSHCVSEITNGHEVIRTTFHPDYDYASFVGAYKPVSEKISNQNNSQSNSSEQIVYRFIAQPFLNAYVEAWKKLCSEEEQDKSVFLVIEELNRGNCAQIFGDVFQLLDRKDNGFSDYPISCDSDIQKYLAESFQSLAFDKLTYIEQIYSKEPSILEELKTGKKLVLPSNLYIYATMNTSDQSLFPIDSAFKRRWSWNYVPITKGIDENGIPIDVSIQIENEKYDWWDFISKINERIESVTNSEDKKLGFFFCKARNGIITADDFVGKALFYIWNDVFKDYGFDDEIFKLNDNGERLKFSSFYEFKNNKTQPNCAVIRTFLKNLDIAIKDKFNGNGNDSNSEDSATNAISSSVNNSGDLDNEGTTES